jgi:hypothetical protein
MALALAADSGGTTSLRLATDKPIDENLFPVGAPSDNRIAPPSERNVEQRDRDLGQTFRAPADFTLDTLYLRVGPSSGAVLGGAPGATVLLQFFEVDGAPTVDDSGTPGFLRAPDGAPIFDRGKSPQLDDYVVGETYRSILVATGPLPATLAANDYLVLKVEGAKLAFTAGHDYAFLFGFVDRGSDRSLALANAYFGSFAPDPTNAVRGHAIRREGGGGDPSSPYFRPDLPDTLAPHAAQTPGTLGFPDVDTWRDLFFAITAAH